mmetsp:Transcript_114317/g.221929  ORF Transcript_114317/g.221929 Transcript_114317/m.221929 type:complete len:254 (+) Transcript_114317:234-995(+)
MWPRRQPKEAIAASSCLMTCNRYAPRLGKDLTCHAIRHAQLDPAPCSHWHHSRLHRRHQVQHQPGNQRHPHQHCKAPATIQPGGWHPRLCWCVTTALHRHVVQFHLRRRINRLQRHPRIWEVTTALHHHTFHFHRRRQINCHQRHLRFSEVTTALALHCHIFQLHHRRHRHILQFHHRRRHRLARHRLAANNGSHHRRHHPIDCSWCPHCNWASLRAFLQLMQRGMRSQTVRLNASGSLATSMQKLDQTCTSP